MSIDLPLDRMSVADKLEAMELLWADLSKSPSDVPTPDWHREILQERRRLAEAGEEFLDLDAVMSELEEEARENPGA